MSGLRQEVKCVKYVKSEKSEKYVKSKRIMRLLLCTVIFVSLFETVYAESETKTNANMNEIGTDELISGYSELYGGYLNDGAGAVISNAVSPYSNGFGIEELIERIARGDVPIEGKAILHELMYALFGRIIAVGKHMAAVVAIVILSSFLSVLSDGKSGFEKSGAAKAAYYVCFIAAVSMAASTFYDCLDTLKTAVENLNLFMRCIVPIMITALLSSGAVISAAALEPALLTIIEAASTLIYELFIPLCMIGTGLGIINALSEDLKTTRLIGLINGCVKYGLSVVLTIFVAFAGLRSVAASGADALTLKLTKFASSNLIPIVGGILSDSVETVIRCSSVIKNSVGILGVLVVFFIAVMPLINIGAALIIFRVAAALCEPISDKSMTECISSMASGISMAFSMLAAVSVMFVLIITVMINISL